MIQRYLDRLPLVAILRGVTPEEIVPIGRALVDAGFAIIEVPLNSPRPLESIARLNEVVGYDTLVGAGTVMSALQVRQVADAGGRLIVMPHGDVEVIRRAKALDLVCTPGVFTPTEAFAALKAGADALKLFPAEAMPPAIVKAWRAVLPPGTLLIPVGGIKPESMKAYVEASANGFGLGSALFSPQMSAAEVGRNARAFADAWRAIVGD